MSSPFPPSTSVPGEGTVVVKILPNGDSGLERMSYQYPLKLITPPRPSERRSVLVFWLSYGGGLVAGDQVDLTVDVGAGARLSIVTQGHTKIFKAPVSRRVVTRQRLRARIAGAGAGICVLPDPVQPFAESVYEQAQTFHLEPGASLCLLDWVMQGRAARGEDWDFWRWVGRNEVWTAADGRLEKEGSGPSPHSNVGVGPEGRLLVRDTVVLDRENATSYVGSIRDSMHGHGIFGTLILRGPLMRHLGEFFLAEFAALPRLGARDFQGSGTAAVAMAPKSATGAEDAGPSLEAWRTQRLRLERDQKILWSATGMRGCVVVKFGAAEVEGGRLWVGSMLTREGSVEKHFGKDSMMCVC